MPLSESDDISTGGGGGGVGLGSDFFLFWVLLAGVFLALLADFWFLAVVDTAGVGFLIVTSSSSLSDSLLMDSDSVELSTGAGAGAALAFFWPFGGGVGFFFAAAFKKIGKKKLKTIQEYFFFEKNPVKFHEYIKP